MSISSNHSRSSSYGYGYQFGDTTLTKVFVGGLAWETPRDSLREHFEKYGEILEAVIISDKLTGRSKGYGFVTFKEAKAAEKACEDNAPVINGRKANCNLASLGAKRDKPSIPALAPSPSPPPQNVTMSSIQPGRATVPIPAPPNGGRWYYPAPHQQVVPHYGFSPAPNGYFAPNMSYSQKMGVYNGGYYSNVQVYPMAAAGHHMMPMYPFYQHYNHQSMNFPAHVISAVQRVPVLISKPAAFVPSNAGAVVGV